MQEGAYAKADCHAGLMRAGLCSSWPHLLRGIQPDVHSQPEGPIANTNT